MKIPNCLWMQISAMRVVEEYFKDSIRYIKYSTPLRREMLRSIAGKNLEAQITKDYHRIEKGLSLPSPKRPFGADATSRLKLALSNKSLSRTQPEDDYTRFAHDAMESLSRFNSTAEIDDLVSPKLEDIGSPNLSHQDVATFFETRRSVRNFDPSASIPTEVIREATRLAGLSPSVCNRQSCKTYYFAGRRNIDRILKHQAGNRGFGHTAQGIFVVTSDMQMFGGSGERNQSWIDGGLFAMSLVLALHGLGVGTCMLNWSKRNKASRFLRAEASIPDNENVIALIAVGYPDKNARVARSPRRAIENILSIQEGE
ncbi:nitroreductase family protein [Kocuria sp. LHG3120]|uniref:nitroreductase family protein n=1 Tax=Kocuria sp. LHG3120 TaxID=2804590 RepID=UPI003CF05A33